MDSMSDEAVIFIFIVFILNVILLAKVWGMTNNLRRFMSFYMHENRMSWKIGLIKGESFYDREGNKIDMF